MAEKELKSLQFGVSGDVYKVHDVTARANIGDLDAKVDQAVEDLEGDIAEAVDGLASEQYVDRAIGDAKTEIAEDITEAISDTKTEIASDIADAVAGLASETYVGEAIADAKTEIAEDISDAVAGLASETYVDNGLATKQNTIDADHKLAVNLVNGAASTDYVDQAIEDIDIDDKLEGLASEEYVNNAVAPLNELKDDYEEVKWNNILEHHPASPNLYDASLMIDHKLINYTPYPSPDNYLNTYANSILSGFVPVEEGKTYTISIDKGNGTKVNAGALCFVNATKGSVVGYNAANPSKSYGEGMGSQSQWEKDTNKAEVTYDSATKNNTFTVKEGSGIKYVIFYIKSSTSGDNYWGAHEDLSVVANYKIMLNEGSEALPYEPPYEEYDTVRYEDADNVLRGEVQTTLDNFESEMEVAVEEMVDEALTDINSDMQEFVIDERDSTNLYDSSLMMDHKLINYGSQTSPDGSLVTYADGILSGYVPVEEGKTYILKIRDGQGRAVNCGALCFYKLDGNNKHVGVCGCNYSGSKYGGGANWWTEIAGFVQNSYNDAALTNTFTILEGSNISSVVFYIKKYGSSSGNYWGSHTDLSVVADYQIQLNEGTTALPYEPYGRIREAKWKEADDQIQLELNQQMEDFRADMEDEVGSLVGNPKLTLTMSNNGNTWQIESILKDQLCGEHQVKSIGTITANRTNHLFEFENTYIDGQQIKGASDDITPMNGSCPGRWAGTYIGANHGQSNGYTLTFAEPHGKTNDDIGSVWAKGSVQYVIYEVPSTTTVRVVNALSTPGNGAGTMTHVSGATHTEDMVYTSASMDQMYRAANKVTIHVYDENWKEIPVDKNGVYKSNKFRFVQSYDILAPDKAIQHIREMKAEGQSVTRDNLHDEGIQAFVRQNICYEYSEGNACTVYMRSDFLDTFTGYHGVVQSGAISGTPTASSPEYCYVAGWNNNTPYENYGKDTPSTDFSKSKWDDQSNPPYRYYQFGYGAKRPMGIMQGYYTKIGVGIPSVRTQVLGNSAGFCYTSGKMYPYAYSGKTLQAGDVRETVAFYSPLIMDMTNDNCFASIYNYVYDDIILAIDYQEAADVLYRLRPECVGKQIEVIDKTSNVIMDRTMASSELLPITFEGKGWIVLRFYEKDESFGGGGDVDLTNYITQGQMNTAISNATSGLATAQSVTNLTTTVNNKLDKVSYLGYEKAVARSSYTSATAETVVTRNGEAGEASKMYINTNLVNGTGYGMHCRINVPDDENANKSGAFVRADMMIPNKANYGLSVGDKCIVQILPKHSGFGFGYAFGVSPSPMKLSYCNPEHYGQVRCTADELITLEFTLTERDLAATGITSNGGSPVSTPNLCFPFIYGKCDYPTGATRNVSGDSAVGDYEFDVWAYFVKASDSTSKKLKEGTMIPISLITNAEVEPIVESTLQNSTTVKNSVINTVTGSSAFDNAVEAEVASAIANAENLTVGHALVSEVAHGIGYDPSVPLIIGSNQITNKGGSYTINQPMNGVFKVISTSSTKLVADYGGSIKLCDHYEDEFKGKKLLFKKEKNTTADFQNFQINFGATWGNQSYWSIPSSALSNYNEEWKILDVDAAVNWAKANHSNKVGADFNGIIAIMFWGNTNWQKTTVDGVDYVNPSAYGVDAVEISYTFYELLEDAIIITPAISEQAEQLTALSTQVSTLAQQMQSNGGNVLWGKKYVSAGDSFTQGDFSGWVDENGLSGHNSPVLHDSNTGYYKTYPYWITSRNNMTWINEALCGSIMAYHKAWVDYRDNGTLYNNGTTYVDYTPAINFCSPFAYDRLLRIPADTDFLTIWFGINDSGKCNLGTLADFSGLTSEIEQFEYDGEGRIIKGANGYTTNNGAVNLGTVIDTFYGAYQYALWYLLTNRPNMHIGIIISNGGASSSFRTATKEVAEKWGVPYLDMMDVQSPNMVGNRTGVCAAANQIAKNKWWVTSTNGHPGIYAHEFESNIVESFLRRI